MWTEQVQDIWFKLSGTQALFVFSASAQDIMYPYGAAHRDLETPKMDDGSSPEITLTIQFVFFSVPYRSIYVSLQTKSAIRARFTHFLALIFSQRFSQPTLSSLSAGQQQWCDLLQRAGQPVHTRGLSFKRQ